LRVLHGAAAAAGTTVVAVVAVEGFIREKVREGFVQRRFRQQFVFYNSLIVLQKR